MHPSIVRCLGDGQPSRRQLKVGETVVIVVVLLLAVVLVWAEVPRTEALGLLAGAVLIAVFAVMALRAPLPVNALLRAISAALRP